jgi:hypothetical protein
VVVFGQIEYITSEANEFFLNLFARACNLQQLLIINNLLGVVAHCKATFPALFIIFLVSCVQSTENEFRAHEVLNFRP